MSSDSSAGNRRYRSGKVYAPAGGRSLPAQRPTSMSDEIALALAGSRGRPMKEFTAHRRLCRRVQGPSRNLLPGSVITPYVGAGAGHWLRNSSLGSTVFA